jgi:hypothetical protein
MSRQRTVRRIASRLVGGVFGIVLLLAFVWFVRTMMLLKSNKPSRQVQVVQVIRPPPPPPEQPPPPPPPQKTEQQLPQDKPEPVPDNTQAAADQPLGVDAEGSAGGDAFGLAARRGGADLVGSGSAPFARYTNLISDAIRERLASTDCAKSAKGSLSIHVILEADGRIKQVQLASTTGSRQADQCINAAMTSLPRLSDPLPPGMPEQVNLKIVSRI